MTSLKAFDDRNIPKSITITLVALVLLGSGVLSYYLQSRKSDGYDVNRRYTAKILAIAETKASWTGGPRFAEIHGLNGQKIFLQDPRQKFSNCEVGDVVEYRLDRNGLPGNARFVYNPASCRTP